MSRVLGIPSYFWSFFFWGGGWVGGRGPSALAQSTKFAFVNECEL